MRDEYIQVVTTPGRCGTSSCASALWPVDTSPGGTQSCSTRPQYRKEASIIAVEQEDETSIQALLSGFWLRNVMDSRLFPDLGGEETTGTPLWFVNEEHLAGGSDCSGSSWSVIYTYIQSNEDSINITEVILISPYQTSGHLNLNEKERSGCVLH